MILVPVQTPYGTSTQKTRNPVCYIPGRTPSDLNGRKIEYSFRSTDDSDTRLLRLGRRRVVVVGGGQHVANVMSERGHDHIDISAVSMVAVCREGYSRDTW